MIQKIRGRRRAPRKMIKQRNTGITWRVTSEEFKGRNFAG